MNDVPALFYEVVCRTHYRKTAISEWQRLSGLFGEVAADAFENAAFRRVEMRNGHFHDVVYFKKFSKVNDDWIKFKKVTRKHHWYTAVIVFGGEYSTDNEPAALEELSAATEGKHVALVLKTANVSKELEKWIGSIQFCFSLQILEWSDNPSALAGKIISFKKELEIEELGFIKCTAEEQCHLEGSHPQFIHNLPAIRNFRNYARVFILKKEAAGIYWYPAQKGLLLFA